VAIFANGQSERAHGISDAQSFSLVAVRAERILASLLEGRSADALTADARAADAPATGERLLEASR
jgi:lysine/ornithine N-monooxygenase